MTSALTLGHGAAWTPGPWLTNCSHIYAPDKAIIAVVHNPGRQESDYPLVANRDLMAAAPELYDALKLAAQSLFIVRDVLQRMGADDMPNLETVTQLSEATLAKARGES